MNRKPPEHSSLNPSVIFIHGVYCLLPCKLLLIYCSTFSNLLSRTTFSSRTKVQRLVNEFQPRRLFLVIIVVVIERKGKSVTSSHNEQVERPNRTGVFCHRWGNQRNKRCSQKCYIERFLFCSFWASRPQRWNNEKPPPPEAQNFDRCVPLCNCF